MIYSPITSLFYFSQRFDMDSWGSDENDNITGIFDSVMFCMNGHHSLFCEQILKFKWFSPAGKKPQIAFKLFSHCFSYLTNYKKAFIPVLRVAHCKCKVWGSLVFSGEQSEPSLWDSWNSLHSHPFPPDLVNLPAVSTHDPNPSVPRYNPTVFMPINQSH